MFYFVGYWGSIQAGPFALFTLSSTPATHKEEEDG